MYELTIALKPDLSAASAKRVVEKIEEAVKGVGGTVEKIDSLGIKPLAYPIKKVSQASFARLRFQVPPKEVAGLQAEFKKDENLLRALIIKGGEANG